MELGPIVAVCHLIFSAIILVAAWRAMRAHERLADAVERIAEPSQR